MEDQKAILSDPKVEIEVRTVNQQTIQVLLVDDERVLEDHVDGLSRDGIQVLRAENWQEARELFEQHPIDVVVIDPAFDDERGWITLIDMRRSPLSAGTPVIVLSETFDEFSRILAFKHGVQQYAAKPIGTVELSLRIASLNGNRTAPREQHDESRRVPVRKGGHTLLLDEESILYFSSKNKSSYAHTYENQYLVDMTLSELEEKTRPGTYLRTHRSYLVALRAIREIGRQNGGHVTYLVDRDATVLPVARRRVKELQNALGL